MALPRVDLILDDDLTTDEMPLNDQFQDFGMARVVPHLVRIDDRDGALQADLQAIGFRA